MAAMAAVLAAAAAVALASAAGAMGISSSCGYSLQQLLRDAGGSQQQWAAVAWIPQLQGQLCPGVCWVCFGAVT
jgi:hypothetical protein